jgi:hypothetical protein
LKNKNSKENVRHNFTFENSAPFKFLDVHKSKVVFFNVVFEKEEEKAKKCNHRDYSAKHNSYSKNCYCV